MPDTNFINLIAVHATAGTAAPTKPSKGSNVADWTTPGFKTIGSRVLNSDSADLADGNISVDLDNIIKAIRAPKAMANQDHAYFGSLLEEFSFEAFDLSEEVMDLSSNITVTSNKAQPSTTLTRRTLIVEITGYAMFVLPKVLLMHTGLGLGLSEGGTTKFIVRPEEDTTYKAGWYMDFYQ